RFYLYPSHLLLLPIFPLYFYFFSLFLLFFFFFNDTAPTEIYTLSLHDALPICAAEVMQRVVGQHRAGAGVVDLECFQTRDDQPRSEEHTSELQSPCNLVCRLLLEKKKKKKKKKIQKKKKII